jgi:hypothetical protein
MNYNNNISFNHINTHHITNINTMSEEKPQTDSLRGAFKLYMKERRARLTDEQKALILEKQRSRYAENKEKYKESTAKNRAKMGGREAYNKYMRDYRAKVKEKAKEAQTSEPKA